MEIDEALDTLKNAGLIVEGRHAGEIPPENYELIEEILENPFCDCSLTIDDLKSWSYDDLENYLFELMERQNEERAIYGTEERM